MRCLSCLKWLRTNNKYSLFLFQSQEALLDHCRLAGIAFMVLVSDKEGTHIKVSCKNELFFLLV